MNHWGRIRTADKVKESKPLTEDTYRSDPIFQVSCPTLFSFGMLNYTSGFIVLRSRLRISAGAKVDFLNAAKRIKLRSLGRSICVVRFSLRTYPEQTISRFPFVTGVPIRQPPSETSIMQAPSHVYIRSCRYQVWRVISPCRIRDTQFVSITL